MTSRLWFAASKGWFESQGTCNRPCLLMPEGLEARGLCLRAQARAGHFTAPRPRSPRPLLGCSSPAYLSPGHFSLSSVPSSQPHSLHSLYKIASCTGVSFSLVLPGKLFMVKTATVHTRTDNPRLTQEVVSELAPVGDSLLFLG